jgi:hypothetical protein
MVSFDIALMAMEGTATKRGIGLVVGMVTLGSTGQSKEESSSVSHVKFSVPVSLPEYSDYHDSGTPLSLAPDGNILRHPT